MSWSECQDISRKLDHFAREVSFEGVMKDPYRGLHYRFHRKELPAHATQADFSDKKLFLTIFDEYYAKVGEMILDNRHYPSKVSFISDKGLYVAAPENSDETLVFYVFDVHVALGERKTTSELVNF